MAHPSLNESLHRNQQLESGDFFLKVAGLTPPEEMTGRTLLKLLTSGQSGNVEANRDAIEELLVLKDQIDYLSYSLRLRRIKETETSYEDKVANVRKTSPSDKIIWPVYKEIWEDEIINFQSVLENRCL